MNKIIYVFLSYTNSPSYALDLHKSCHYTISSIPESAYNQSEPEIKLSNLSYPKHFMQQGKYQIK